MNNPNRLWTWAAILVFSAAAGMFFTVLFVPNGKMMVGAFFGLWTAVPMLAFTRGLFLSDLQRKLRRLPFPLYAPVSVAIYIAMIVVSTAIAGTLVWQSGVLPDHGLAELAIVNRTDLIYALSILAIIMFMLRIRDLIGTDVFLSLLTGRYHKPVQEERIFLFIDVAGSTQFAERYGDLRAQQYLGSFFAALAEPVRSHLGAIDDYVGDLAIISWPLERGAKNALCVRCIFAIAQQTARDEKLWRSQFGTVPRFRAALHGGSVVAGEVGVDRHKIAYFGDTVNTTARLEALCRELERPYLISADLMSRIPRLPPGITATDLGSHDLRGRDRPLAVAALTAASRQGVERQLIAA